jgi:hypothetical protein
MADNGDRLRVKQRVQQPGLAFYMFQKAAD